MINKSLILGRCFIKLAGAMLLSVPVCSSAQTELIDRDTLVYDEDGSAYQIRQPVFKNSNGTLTLVPGQRPYDLKAMHERICRSVGGHDVYDDTIITITDDVVDAAICNITDPEVLANLPDRKNSVRVTAGRGGDKREAGDVSAQDLWWAPGLELSPANGEVPIGSRYRIRGYINYFTKDGGRYTAGHRVDKCAGNFGGTVGANAKGVLYAHVLCQTHNAGQWTSYLDACIPGLCASATGTVWAKD